MLRYASLQPIGTGRDQTDLAGGRNCLDQPGLVGGRNWPSELMGGRNSTPNS